jgi:hypothetical protein
MLIFFVGMLTFHRLHKQDKYQNSNLFTIAVVQTFFQIDWERPLVGLKQYLPIHIMIALVIGAVVHSVMAIIFPRIFISDEALLKERGKNSRPASLIALEEGRSTLRDETHVLKADTFGLEEGTTVSRQANPVVEEKPPSSAAR